MNEFGLRWQSIGTTIQPVHDDMDIIGYATTLIMTDQFDYVCPVEICGVMVHPDDLVVVSKDIAEKAVEPILDVAAK